MASDQPSVGVFQCPDCGAEGPPGGETIMRVWEDPTDYSAGKVPDWLACMECHTMHEMGEVQQPITDGGRDRPSMETEQRRQNPPQLGVDEISLSSGSSRGWYVWRVDGFGIVESDAEAQRAEEAGEEVTLLYE